MSTPELPALPETVSSTPAVQSKPKRKYTWTEKRKEAFERCRKAREAQVQKIHSDKANGIEQKNAEKRKLQELVKNTSKMKELLEILNTSSQVSQSVPKAVDEKQVVVKAKAKKPPKIVYESASESSEEEVIVKKKPKAEKSIEPEPENLFPNEPIQKPKPVMYYRPKVTVQEPPKPAPVNSYFEMKEQKQQVMQQRPQIEVRKPANSLVFL